MRVSASVASAQLRTSGVECVWAVVSSTSAMPAPRRPVLERAFGQWAARAARGRKSRRRRVDLAPEPIQMLIGPFADLGGSDR